MLILYVQGVRGLGANKSSSNGKRQFHPGDRSSRFGEAHDVGLGSNLDGRAIVGQMDVSAVQFDESRGVCVSGIAGIGVESKAGYFDSGLSTQETHGWSRNNRSPNQGIGADEAHLEVAGGVMVPSAILDNRTRETDEARAGGGHLAGNNRLPASWIEQPGFIHL